MCIRNGERCQDLELWANFYENRISTFELNGYEQLCKFQLFHSTVLRENLYENHILCKLIWITFKWVFQCIDWIFYLISIISLDCLKQKNYENHILCKLIWIAFKWVFQCIHWTINSRMRFKPLNHLGHAIYKLW